MAADIDCVVLGAGVIGLAIARRLAMAGREVLVAEAGSGIGTGISSRNSEVIHAGIYYAPGSLKAELCVAGRQQLYAYCQERGIPFKRCGKLIVASTAPQVQRLDAIAAQARRNGVDDLGFLTGPQARKLEPALHCDAALLSPSTGIVDSHALMLALQGDAESHGAQCVFHTPYNTGKVLANGQFQLSFGGTEPMVLTSNCVINATGLSAPAVAHAMSGLRTDTIPRAYLCKGSYFALSGQSPFGRLIYPMPDDAGLGVHLTLDMAGQAKFGPDTEWVHSEDYGMDPDRAYTFYKAIRQYWPDLPDNSLSPAYTGIRPKIVPQGQSPADFLISDHHLHGVPGLINLFGIESPGLTACMAIADMVCSRLNQPATPGPVPVSAYAPASPATALD